MTPELKDLIELARNHVWTEEEKRLFAISFAYGNCKLDGCDVTKEGIEKAYDELHGGEEE